MLKNTHAILVLGFLSGFIISFGGIGASAFLLEHLDPSYIVGLNFLCIGIFTLFLKYSDYENLKIKFALFTAILMIFPAVISFIIASPFIGEEFKAIAWYIVATSANAFIVWNSFELTTKHLDPARAKSYLSYQVVAIELGKIISLFLIKYFLKLNPGEMILILGGLFILVICYQVIQFVLFPNFEIKFSKKEETIPSVPDQDLKKFFSTFIFTVFSLGIAYTTSQYIVRVILKEELISFEKIKDVMSSFLIVISFLTIVVSTLIGKISGKIRISPTTLFLINSGGYLVFGIFCFFERALYAFIILEVVRNIVSVSCFNFGNQILTTYFINNIRRKLKASLRIWSAIIPSLLLMGFLFVMNNLWGKKIYEKEVILLLIISFSFLGIIFSNKLKKISVKLLYSYLGTQHKTAQILAVDGLSAFGPKNFTDKMRDILKENPKKILKKTIILSLGHEKSEKAMDTVIEEFKSEQETVQMAVIDAINTSRSYYGINFIIGIGMSHVKSKSLRVRLNATKVLAGLLGKHAIPFILEGLKDNDSRIVANAIEALSYYRDPQLLTYFMKYSEHKEPRVVANALYALSAFRQTREMCNEKIVNILNSENYQLINSVLYVIGKMESHKFKNELINLKNKNQKLNKLIYSPNLLAWAFLQTHLQDGPEMFAQLFLKLDENSKKSDEMNIIHFYSQLPKAKRFDVIIEITKMVNSLPVQVAHAGTLIRESQMDFGEELEYFNFLSNRFKNKVV